MGREHHGGTKKIMSDHSKLTRAGSVKPLKLSPRRDFGPAQDFPTRLQYSLKGKASSSSSKDHEIDANSNDGGGKKQFHMCAGIIRKNNKKVANNNAAEDVLTTVFSTKVRSLFLANIFVLLLLACTAHISKYMYKEAEKVV